MPDIKGDLNITGTGVLTAPNVESKYVSRAWGVFDGTLSSANIVLADNLNVSNIQKEEVGNYRITLANPMLNTDYVVSGSTVIPSGGMFYVNKISTTQFYIMTYAFLGSKLGNFYLAGRGFYLADSPQVSFAVFGSK